METIVGSLGDLALSGCSVGGPERADLGVALTLFGFFMSLLLILAWARIPRVTRIVTLVIVALCWCGVAWAEQCPDQDPAVGDCRENCYEHLETCLSFPDADGGYCVELWDECFDWCEEKTSRGEEPRVAWDQSLDLGIVYFDSGGTKPLPQKHDEIKRVANAIGQFINYYGDVIIVIEGHTDSRGSVMNNLDLGEKRAEEVRRLLKKEGVPAAVLRVATFGEIFPIASNLTEEGRAKNRRVEIYLVK
jgi:hypothetical protein